MVVKEIQEMMTRLLEKTCFKPFPSQNANRVVVGAQHLDIFEKQKWAQRLNVGLFLLSKKQLKPFLWARRLNTVFHFVDTSAPPQRQLNRALIKSENVVIILINTGETFCWPSRIEIVQNCKWEAVPDLALTMEFWIVLPGL
jgi:hypothetical protein